VLQCFQKEEEAREREGEREGERERFAVEEGGGRKLRCSACGNAVTSTGERIEVGGAHVHERENPHGYLYRFGCFAAAPGCASAGVPSRQHTWFAGCWWQVQVCAACAAHLGWLFFGDGGDGGGDGGIQFWALILDRLVEEADERGETG